MTGGLRQCESVDPARDMQHERDRVAQRPLPPALECLGFAGQRHDALDLLSGAPNPSGLRHRPQPTGDVSQLSVTIFLDNLLALVELQQAGLAIDHLSDEQVCDLGRRVAQAATPSIRN